MNKIKRHLSFVLAVLMLVIAIPVGDFVTFAAVGDYIEITNIYDDGQMNNVSQTSIDMKIDSIKGSNYTFSLMYYDGKDSELIESTGNQDGYDYHPRLNESGKPVYGIVYNGKHSSTSIPRIDKIEPTQVEAGELVTITGENFNNDNVEISNRKGKLNEGVVISDKKIWIRLPEDSEGSSYNIKLTGETSVLGTVSTTVTNIYNDAFTIRGKLNVSDDIKMTPNMGSKDTIIELRGSKLPDKFSVFLRRPGENLNIENRAIDYDEKNPGEPSEDTQKKGSYVYRFKVPESLTPGRTYEVLLTNYIQPNGQDFRISSLATFENNSFTLLDAGNQMQITNIDPNFGPETGKDDVEIKGVNVLRPDKSVFKFNESDLSKIRNIAKDGNRLKITYNSENNDEIGEYKYIRPDGKNPLKVKKLEREIYMYIGNEVEFEEDVDIAENSETFKVNIPRVTLEDGENTWKDAVLHSKMILHHHLDDKTTEIKEEYIYNGEVDDPGAFEFRKTDFKPRIDEIYPTEIPVKKDGDGYKIAKDFKMTISGENFLTYLYKDSNNENQLKNPEITIDGVNNSIFDHNSIVIKDNRGNILDGQENRQLGSILTIDVKKDIKLEGINTGNLNDLRNLILRNPLKTEDDDMGESHTGEISFVEQSDDTAPLIERIVPEDGVPSDGQTGVIIHGTNFDKNLSLRLDGEEITPIEHNSVGTQLTFDLPAKNISPSPNKDFEIIVQNPNGELDTVFINYIEPGRDIIFTDFNPKKGTEDTLVTITGDTFLQASNGKVTDITGNGIYRLIGTRVLLGDKDINEYNTEEGEIELKEFDKAPENWIKAKDRELVVDDIYHDIILDDGNNNYYSITFDEKIGKYKITDGGTSIYTLGLDSGKVKAYSGNTPVDLKVEKDKLVLGKKTLTIKTPYKIEGEQIVGNRVKVLNPTEMRIRIPKKAREGLYDITVQNPDTKKDSKVGEEGFYYSARPETKPKITDIDPDEGSIEGGYKIVIEGEGFVDRGEDQQGNPRKSIVVIGGIQIPAEETLVSTDGKKLTVTVPAYSGDLAQERPTMDRKQVPVVVLNPDGATASDEKGFTYIIPKSFPQIDRLVLNRGSAAGGETVTIQGNEFRYSEPYTDNDNPEADFNDLNENGKWDDLRTRKVWIDGKEKNIEELDRKIKDESGKTEWDRYVVPILPKVYFGTEKAEIVNFSDSEIEVKTPAGVNGTVEVYIVNNDHGTSNKLPFTYESTNPNIVSVTPSEGRRQGRQNIYLDGSGFEDGEVEIYESADEISKEKMVKVQFGLSNEDYRMDNITNRHLPIADENSGRIRDRKANVKVENLTVDYEYKGEPKLNVTLETNSGKIYELKDMIFKDKEVFLPLNLLKEKDGEGNYDGFEMVRIDIDNTEVKRVIVDRGFSPDTTFVNPRQVLVKTPSYYTVGDVQMELTNPDNAKATNNFTYINPDSNPKITDIWKDGREQYEDRDKKKIVKLTHTGGNRVSIKGSDFRQPVKVYIGGEEVNNMQGVQGQVQFDYEPKELNVYEEINFTMPAVDEEYTRKEPMEVVVVNADGGGVDSPPIYIEFTKPETLGMELTAVTPSTGPTKGGTEVTIHGNDFREELDGFDDELKVYFERGNRVIEISKEDIISVSFDKIVLKTPAFTAGSVNVRVVNPDGNNRTLLDGFTYVSNPLIDKIVDPENDKSIINNISIDGGDLIKIKGSDFMDGARAIFNPDLRLLSDNETEASIEGELVVINGKRFELNYDGDKEVTAAKQDDGEGQDTYIEFIDGQNLIVKTPSGSIGDNGVIVINPDGAVSNLYNIEYGIPEIGAPMDVRAELVYDQFIRIKWSGVSAANEYEIYVKIEDGDYQFVGSTTETSYAYENIESRTKYRFMVKAIGEYGSSKPLEESESNSVTTGRDAGPEDIDGELGEYTDIDRQGENANITIGTRDFGSEGYTIDLTRGELAGAKKLSIRIPAEIVSGYGSGEIRILGPDYSMKFRPEVFRNTRIDENKNNNAGVVFNIQPYKGPNGSSTGSIVSGPIYDLNAKVFVGMNGTDVDRLAGGIDLVLDDNPMITQSRRLRNLSLSRYYEAGNNWVNTMRVDRMALYAITGSRR